ncbi:hypothetical protein GH714_007665 [Hevea brasiliensis]|uniref:Uncharacterized protein n=1 Tax=Hevea brasiliensis TaxID=3981 RepID=A0A6A6L1L1_HEVBR|nr:hypothetical protein GH714_007665 [Hevea brasiliensis]
MKDKGLILNIFDELDKEVLDVINTTFPVLYTIGPLSMLQQNLSSPKFESIESNLWKEDNECLSWLDKREPKSVVYVNFGSLITVVFIGVPEMAASTAVPKTQIAEIESLRLKDLKAKNYLFQAIDRATLETILHKDTSKQIWDSMKKKYQGSARARRQQLQALHSEFKTLWMKSGESITDYFSRVMTIVNKMRIHGDKTEDITIIEKILRSMTSNLILLSVP